MVIVGSTEPFLAMFRERTLACLQLPILFLTQKKKKKKKTMVLMERGVEGSAKGQKACSKSESSTYHAGPRPGCDLLFSIRGAGLLSLACSLHPEPSPGRICISIPLRRRPPPAGWVEVNYQASLSLWNWASSWMKLRRNYQ